jgi:hypothetical protein
MRGWGECGCPRRKSSAYSQKSRDSCAKLDIKKLRNISRR